VRVRVRVRPSLDIECAIVTGALYSDFRQTSTVHNMRCLLSDSELLASDLFVFCIHHHHGHGADLLAGTAAACPLGTSAYLIARRENRIKQTPNHSKLACSAPLCRRSADVRASGSLKPAAYRLGLPFFAHRPACQSRTRRVHKSDGKRSACRSRLQFCSCREKAMLEPDRRHMACLSGPPVHTARPPRLSGRDTRARTYNSGL
jgi:hypothetical protein